MMIVVTIVLRFSRVAVPSSITSKLRRALGPVKPNPPPLFNRPTWKRTSTPRSGRRSVATERPQAA